ncbi:MAG: hypothetical protein Q9228_005149, partial [Teloschistes exilis]
SQRQCEKRQERTKTPTSIPDRFPRVDVVYVPSTESDDENEPEPEHDGENEDKVESVQASGEDSGRSTGPEPVQGN